MKQRNSIGINYVCSICFSIAYNACMAYGGGGHTELIKVSVTQMKLTTPRERDVSCKNYSKILRFCPAKLLRKVWIREGKTSQDAIAKLVHINSSSY